MLKMLLYVVATFMETAIGIWLFAKIYPKRRCMDTKHHVSEGALFTVIVSGIYSFPNFYFEINNKQKYLKIIVTFYAVVLLMFILNKFRRKAWNNLETRIVESALFTGMIIWLGCQYWTSYESAFATLLGNILPVLFLFAFFECTIVKAYLWQLLYLSNLGLLKIVYITYEGSFGNRYFQDFMYSPRVHSYSEIVYWLGILGAIAILFHYIPINRILDKILNTYKGQLFLVGICEWATLLVLMNFGIGEIYKEDLAVALIIVIIIMFCLLFMVIKLLGKTIDAERNLLDVRNEAMECQYQELRQSYEKYRCLLHDEKHMIFYLKECLDKGNVQEGKAFLENYHDNIVNTEKRSWTGMVTLDFILNTKKRKMDELKISFLLDSRVENIPMKDADFVAVMANLFDNAIEACEKCQIEKRKIELSVQSINQMFIIIMKNAYLSEPSVKNNHFITNKSEKNKHGWGIESVKHIVGKYDGQITFKYNNSIFEVAIIINE